MSLLRCLRALRAPCGIGCECSGFAARESAAAAAAAHAWPAALSGREPRAARSAGRYGAVSSSGTTTTTTTSSSSGGGSSSSSSASTRAWRLAPGLPANELGTWATGTAGIRRAPAAAAAAAAASAPVAWRRTISASSGPQHTHGVELSEGEYQRVADAALDHLQERLEEFVEDNDVDGGDVEYSSGVLTVKLGRHGTYVINKQAPNRQIWLSSPVSGPFRYDYAGAGRWAYSRDGREMHEQLQAELSGLLGSAPDLTSGLPS